MTKGKVIILTAVILLFLNVLIDWLNMRSPATGIIRLLSFLVGLIACFIPSSWLMKQPGEHEERIIQSGKPQQGTAPLPPAPGGPSEGAC